MIEAERDAWVLMAAQPPEQMPPRMELTQRQFDDPAVVDLYRGIEGGR